MMLAEALFQLLPWLPALVHTVRHWPSSEDCAATSSEPIVSPYMWYAKTTEKSALLPLRKVKAGVVSRKGPVATLGADDSTYMYAPLPLP